ncbi:hypothetical protein HYPSUDRAFT_127584 [Hypholoma sublateritium FD-334 SS-4]|uniref:Carbohydrate-binding module family 19 domain-containing protein n=1 Tax=Hypholoma sublateritium (strain FD-334 SS-4) TaxID=945553 RepID=A0A0D2QCK6_HYPSF|nr:hypothetical protein HYPSUDRAFT_127584 [Hypholoma sublateritium FD-334 SS-4]
MQITGFFVTLALSLSLSASARTLQYSRVARRAGFDLANGQAAIALNNKFKTLSADSACTDAEPIACVQDKLAQCVSGKFVIQPCASGTICAALPLVNSPGTSITCTTADDLAQRIAAVRASFTDLSTGAQDTGSDGQSTTSAATSASTSTKSHIKESKTQTATDSTSAATKTAAAPKATASAGTSVRRFQVFAVLQSLHDITDKYTSFSALDPAVIAKGFANDGQDVPTAGQVASLTSTNNFINFCKTVNLPLTNGEQVTGGSCNPAPMGSIPSKSVIPSSKFLFPKNTGTVAANTNFTVKMRIKNLATGNFVNAEENYFSAPQQLNAQGVIVGHSHVVIEKIASLTSTAVSDPTVFAFFKGLNSAASADGVLEAEVTGGLPAGVYKLSSINSAANHQPVLAPVAQHGSLDDVVYVSLTSCVG